MNCPHRVKCGPSTTSVGRPDYAPQADLPAALSLASEVPRTDIPILGTQAPCVAGEPGRLEPSENEPTGIDCVHAEHPDHAIGWRHRRRC